MKLNSMNNNNKRLMIKIVVRKNNKKMNKKMNMNMSMNMTMKMTMKKNKYNKLMMKMWTIRII